MSSVSKVENSVTMEEHDATGPRSGEGSEKRGKTLQILQAGSVKEILGRSSGGHKSQPAREGSLSLEQWEVQWQGFLRTLESPHSPWRVQHSPHKPSPWEDAKAFLASFEQVAEACQWPKEEWVTRLLPALSGEAGQALSSLGDTEREDYGKVKTAILRGDALCREKKRQQFRCFCYQEAEGPQEAYRKLQEMCRGWLRVENHSKEQILELLILEQLLIILPPEIQSRVRQSSPESCSHAVALAEEFLSQQGKQIATGSVSKAGRVPCESEPRQLLMDIKEEEDGEDCLLAGGAEKMVGEFEAECNFRDQHGPQRKEGSCVEKMRYKSIPCPGGEFWEIPAQEEKSVKKRRNKGLHANQRIHPRENENESLVFEKTLSQSTRIISQEQIPSGDRSNNCSECGKSFGQRIELASYPQSHAGDGQQTEEDEELHQLSPDKTSNREMNRNFQNHGEPKKQEEGQAVDKMDDSVPCQGMDISEIIYMPEETYKCWQCGLYFSKQSQYNIHLRLHSGKKIHKCSECGKSFLHQSEFLRHHRIHTGEKPYSCADCGRSFSHKSNLIKHQIIHFGEKPFIWLESGKSFSDGEKGDVLEPKHSRWKKCFQCGKYFRCRSELFVHQRTHTGEKPFECSECGKKFSQSYSLQKHLRTHTGAKPFECSECGKKFIQSCHLQKHVRTHTGEKPFECLECGERFIQKSHLQRHQRVHLRRTRIAGQPVSPSRSSYLKDCH